jgi:hypothetical protein
MTDSDKRNQLLSILYGIQYPGASAESPTNGWLAWLLRQDTMIQATKPIFASSEEIMNF